MSQEPLADWELSEIQDRVEQEWGIRLLRTTILRHAANFYEKHHLPLFYKTGFTEDKYRLNTSVEPELWEKVFEHRQKGRPRKVPRGTTPPSLEHAARRKYDIRYKKAKKYLYEHILKLFEDQAQGTDLTANEIRDHVRGQTGVRFSNWVIERQIHRYNDRFAPPYIDAVEPNTKSNTPFAK